MKQLLHFHSYFVSLQLIDHGTHNHLTVLSSFGCSGHQHLKAFSRKRLRSLTDLHPVCSPENRRQTLMNKPRSRLPWFLNHDRWLRKGSLRRSWESGNTRGCPNSINDCVARRSNFILMLPREHSQLVMMTVVSIACSENFMKNEPVPWKNRKHVPDYYEALWYGPEKLRS